MVVRFRRRMQIEGVDYEAGDEADLPTETARALHGSGAAEIVAGKRLRQPEQNRIRRPRENRSAEAGQRR